MRKLIIYVVADQKAYTAGLTKAAHATKTFGKEMERAGKGAVLASLNIKGLHRGLLSLSAPFVGGFAVAEAFKSTVDAGEEAIATQRQLARQLRTSGIAFHDVKGTIDDALNSLSLLSGFNVDELTQGFTQLVRVTGSVGRSLDLVKIAADVARGRHISLAQAAIALSKAESGNLTSLRRLGIEIPKGVTSFEALRIVAGRYAGQAKSGTTATERFQAELHNTAAIIGTSLLPTVNLYLGRLAVWLDKMNRSGKLQKDVKQGAHDVGVAFGITAGVIKGADVIWRKFLGSWVGHGLQQGAYNFGQSMYDVAHTLGLVHDANTSLVTTQQQVNAAFKQGGIEAQLYIQALKNFSVNPAINPLAQGPTGFGATTAAAAATAGPNALQGIPSDREVGKLIDQARKGKGATAAQRNQWFDAMIGRAITRVQDIPSLKQEIVRLREIGVLIQQRAAATKDVTRRLTLGDTADEVRRQIRATQQTIASNDQARKQAAKAAAQQRKQDRLAREANARQAILDRLGFQHDRADTLGRFAQAAEIDRVTIAAIKKQIRDGHGTLELTRQLFDAQQDILAENKKISDARAAARTARLYKDLGLGATGQELAPSAANLRKRLGQITDAIQGTFLDTNKTRGVLARIRHALKDGLKGMSDDVRNTIKGMLDDVRKQLDQQPVERTRFRQLDASKFIAGLGVRLTATQRQALTYQLGRLGPNMTVPRDQPAFAGHHGSTIVMHNPQFHGVHNVSELERQLEARQRARAYRRRGG